MSESKIVMSLARRLNLDLALIAEIVESGSSSIKFDAEKFVYDLQDGVFGQDGVIEEISKFLTGRLDRIGSEPVTLFLAGPTSLGKTVTARAIAKSLGLPLSEVPCSQLQQGGLASLQGAAFGYVGSNQDTQFVTDLKKSAGRLVVLLDEVEKPSREVLNGLLDMLREGRFKDAKLVEHPANCLFIATSNAGAEKWDYTKPATPAAIRAMLGEHPNLSPEFLARFQHFSMFRPLDERARSQVVTKTVESVIARRRLVFDEQKNSMVGMSTFVGRVIKSLDGQVPNGTSVPAAAETLLHDQLGDSRFPPKTAVWFDDNGRLTSG